MLMDMIRCACGPAAEVEAAVPAGRRAVALAAAGGETGVGEEPKLLYSSYPPTPAITAARAMTMYTWRLFSVPRGIAMLFALLRWGKSVNCRPSRSWRQAAGHVRRTEPGGDA